MARKSTEEKKAEFIEFWKDENENIGNERLKNSNTGIEKMPKKKRTLTLADYKYKKRIKEAMIPSKEYIEMMHKNYPDLTEKEILELLKKQRKYKVYFHHQHEGITANLIKKYLLLDKYDSDVVKITLDTPETHDCNLVKLTPELQEKAYWGYRGGRRVISHLINRDDYPGGNKTNKLTVVGKRDVWMDYDEDGVDEYGEPYFYVITAFWGDGKSKREPKEDYHGNYDYEEMEYWMNHALIPEKDEKITQTDSPEWVEEYKQQKKEKEMMTIYKKGKELEYKAFQKYIKNFLLEIGRRNSNIEIVKESDSSPENRTVDSRQYVMAINKGDFGIIEVKKTGEDIIYRDDEDVEEYRQRILNNEFQEGFSAKIIKDINNENNDIPEEIVDFRQDFIKKYFGRDILGKIIKSAEEIKNDVKFDKEGNKISTIIIGNKEYQFLNPNLENHSDEKYSSNVTGHYTCIQRHKRIEADLDGIRGDDPDCWQNKKLAEYVKMKKTEGFIIPGEKFKNFLADLGKECGIESTGEKLLLLLYLTGMDGDFWYYTNGYEGYKIKFSEQMLRSNVGNVSGGLILMRCKELKE